MDTASTTPAAVTPSVDVPVSTPSDSSSVTPPVVTSASNTGEKKSWGALIAIILILAAIVVGAFYAWGKRIAQSQQTPDTIETAQ